MPAIPQRKASLAAGAPLHNRYIDPTLSLSTPGPSSGALQPSALPMRSQSSASRQSYGAAASPVMDMYRSSDSDDSTERRSIRPRPSARRKARPSAAEPLKRRSVALEDPLPGLTSSQSEVTSVVSSVARRGGPKRQMAPPPVVGARKGLAIALAADHQEWDRPAEVDKHIQILLEGKHLNYLDHYVVGTRELIGFGVGVVSESRKANEPHATYTSDLGSGISSESSRENSPPLVSFHSPLQTRFAAPFSTLAAHDHHALGEEVDPVALHADHIVFPAIATRPARSRETSRDTHSVASSIRSADSWSRVPWSPTGAAASPATTVGTPYGSAAQSPASLRQARSSVGQAPESLDQNRKLYFPSPPPKSAARQPVSRHLHEASPPASYTAGSTIGDGSAASEVTASPGPRSTFPGPPVAGGPRQRGQSASAGVEAGAEPDEVLDAYFASQRDRDVPASRVQPGSSVFARTSVFPSKSLFNPRSAPLLSTAVFPTRPTELSFRSTTDSLTPSGSLDSVVAPLYPVAASGRMEALLHQKRVSRAPWEDGGDELDWIVAAQKKLEPRVHGWLHDESEEDHLSSDGLGPKGEATTIRKSLEPTLLSETLSMMDLHSARSVAYEAQMLSPVLGGGARRASTSSTMSGQSEYVDALPEVDDAEDLEELAPRKLESNQQQTSIWVLDALAAGHHGHSLSAIGEAEEHEERAVTPLGARPLTERRNTVHLSIVSPPPSPAEAPEMMRSDTNGTVIAPVPEPGAQPEPVPVSVPGPRTAGSSSSGGLLAVPLPSPGGSLRSPTSPEFDYGSFPPVPMYQHSNNSSVSTSTTSHVHAHAHTHAHGSGYVSSAPGGGSRAAKKVLGALFKAGGAGVGRPKTKLGAGVGSHDFDFSTVHAGISSDSLRSSADSFSTGRGSDLDSFRLVVEQRFGAGAGVGAEGGRSPAGEELEEEVLKTEEMRALDERMAKFKEEERMRFKALVRGVPGRVAVA